MKARWASIAGVSCAMVIALANDACSSKKTTPGELMVVFETDMVLPKDIDDVDVQVLQGDESLFSQSLATGPSGLKLPSTLALVAGSDTATPVRIRAVGRRHGSPRMLREVITNVPSDRVAMLRVPLTWWCDGSATTIGDSSIASTCTDGRTCVAGACASPSIDASTLPTFDPTQVFGGMADPALGACFDTTACLSGATQVPVDLGACTVPKPPSDGAGVNLAVLLPPGTPDGFCDDRGCILPLDADGESAWLPTAGATIALPSVVCDRIRNGAQLAVLRSTLCPSKVQRTPSCSAGSSVGSSDAGPDTTPVTLAGPLNNVQVMTIGGGRLVWVTAFAIQTVPVGGGATTTIASNPTPAIDFLQATDTAALVADALNQGSVTLYPFDAASSITLATNLGSITGMTTDGQHVYVVGGTGLANVEAIPIGGGTPVALVQSPPGSEVIAGPLAVDSNEVFYVSSTNGAPGATIMAVPVQGGPGRTIASTTQTGNVTAIALDASDVYWVEASFDASSTGTISKASRAGGAAIPIAVKQSAVRSIAIDDAYVYWTLRGDQPDDWRNGSVKKTLKSGAGAVLTVALDEPGPTSLAVDATSVYWSNSGTQSASFTDGAIRRAFK